MIHIIVLVCGGFFLIVTASLYMGFESSMNETSEGSCYDDKGNVMVGQVCIVNDYSIVYRFMGFPIILGAGIFLVGLIKMVSL